MVTRTKILISNILSTISLIVSIFIIITTLCGCKLCLKDYESSIGELTAETVSK